MLLTMRTDDGGFLVGDTATRRAEFASPNSMCALTARAEPAREYGVAETMLAHRQSNLPEVELAERDARWLKVLIAASTGSGFPRWQGPEHT